MSYIYSVLGLGVNYIYPIFIIPFIVSRYGVEGFGKYSVILAVFNIVNVIVSYGFDLSLPSIFKEKVNAVYKQVVCIRLIVYIVVFIPTLITPMLLNIKLSGWIFVALFLLVGAALSPNYISIYNERFNNIFLSSLVSKLISSILVFVGFFIGVKLDIIIVLFMSWMLLGPLILICLERSQILLGLTIVTEESLFDMVRLGFPVYLSNVLSLSVTSAVLPLVSVLSDFHVAGIYAIVEKLIRGALSLIDSFYNVIYVKAISNIKYGFFVFKNIVIFGVVGIGFLSVIYIFFATEILALPLPYLKGWSNNEQVTVLFISSLIICVCAMGNGAVITMLYPLRKYVVVNYALLASCMLMFLGFLFIKFNYAHPTVLNFIFLLFVTEVISNFLKVCAGLIISKYIVDGAV